MKETLLAYIKSVEALNATDPNYRTEYKITDGTRTIVFGYGYFSSNKVMLYETSNEDDTGKILSTEDGVEAFLAPY